MLVYPSSIYAATYSQGASLPLPRQLLLRQLLQTATPTIPALRFHHYGYLYYVEIIYPTLL